MKKITLNQIIFIIKMHYKKKIIKFIIIIIKKLIFVNLFKLIKIKIIFFFNMDNKYIKKVKYIQFKLKKSYLLIINKMISN